MLKQEASRVDHQPTKAPTCPDCGITIPVPASPPVSPSTRLECPACAGLFMRPVFSEDGQLSGWERAWTCTARLTNEQVELPRGTKAGDVLTVSGHRYRVTWAYDTFGLDPI